MLLRGFGGKLTALATLASPLSCGGMTGAGPSTHVTGTVGGAAVPTTDVAGILFSGAPATEEVAFTNQSDTCAAAAHELSTGSLATDLVALGLSVEVAGGSVGAGTYAIGSAPAAGVRTGAWFATSDAHGALQSRTDASGGTITYTALTATFLSGSFDVTFGTDRVTGSFVAPVCQL